MSGFFKFPRDLLVLDRYGDPIANGSLRFVATGTDNVIALFSDAALTVPSVNPITADVNGYIPKVYIDPATVFDVQIKNSVGAIVQKIEGASVDASFFPILRSLSRLRAYEGGSDFVVLIDGATVSLYRDCTADSPTPTENLPAVVAGVNRIWCQQSWA